ncbi:MAG: ATP-dependent metalloprotease, partial [Beggiatoa sp.]|nr:ATP-dependent metalloprotease [Beggiatoa sp.]
YGRAKSIIDSNTDKLHMMAEAPIKYETIESDQIDDIMAGNTPRAPKGWLEDDRHGPPMPDVKTPTPDPGKADGAIGGPASLH